MASCQDFFKILKLEVRSVIKFLTKEGVKPTEIKERLGNIYGDCSPLFTTVKERSKLFRLGRNSIKDDPCQGRPVEVVTPENIKFVEEVVLGDRHLKTREIVDFTNFSKTTVLRILHDHLHMTKVSARWVPKLLSPLQKQ